MDEQWRAIPGFERYEVSNIGRVRIIHSNYGCYIGKIVSQRVKPPSGYIDVTIRMGSQRRHICVHKLVALSFLGPCPPGMEVNHKDGNKKNNCINNLEYVTRAENMRHASENGLMASMRGESNGSAKLSQNDVLEIRNRISSGEKQQDLADEFSVSKQIISAINTRVAWGWLDA